MSLICRRNIFATFIVMVAIAITFIVSAVVAVAQSPIYYRTAPADVPHMTVFTSTAQASDDYFFMGTFFPRFGRFILIYSPDGELVYYQRTTGNNFDFKPHANGYLTWMDRDADIYRVLDNSYNQVDTIAPVGYKADGHGVQIAEDGRILQMVYDHDNPYDLSAIGGAADALLLDCIIQEQDAAGNVLFEWHTSDHIAPNNLITDPELPGSTENSPYHCNSVEYDVDDGNILVSYRHLDQIVKIDRTTGEIMWKLGGEDSDFTFVNDDENGFVHQHDARTFPGGIISLFDNRTDVSTYSRGVKYQLDMETMTAEKIWEYRHPNSLHTPFIGNMQTLPNGNAMINWGAANMTAGVTASEVTPDGETLFEFGLDSGAPTYRVIRAPWVGTPAEPPTLSAHHNDLEVTLYMSWNGATEHVGYRVFESEAGLYPLEIDYVPRTGFESTYSLTLPKDGHYIYYVTAVDADGNNLGTSHTKTVRTDTEMTFLPIICSETSE